MLRPLAGTTLVLAVVAAGFIGLVVFALDRGAPGPLSPERCSASLNGVDWQLSPTQAENAALLAGASLRRGLPARAATIAIATTLQESRLVNIDHGDRDSVGLFQQRPSQGWGTVEQIMDPLYATNAFYDALVGVSGYTELPVTVAAQRVQRSAFPDAYAQHEERARAWASALTGHSPAALTCSLHPASLGDAAALADRAARDLGGLPLTVAELSSAQGGQVRADASALSPQDPARAAWAVAQWAVAVAKPFDVQRVEVADRRWERADGVWHPAPAGTAAPPAGEVWITVAGLG